MQSRIASLVETLCGVLIGFLVSLAAGWVVYPWFGHAFTLLQNIGITFVFTVLSIVRGYVVRRLFNRLLRRSS
jgi:hypothetical protein